ncbi:MAG: NUDIX hydrolase [Polyangiaceae bacterium]
MRYFEPLAAWQILTDTALISKRWLEVREQRVRLGNGSEIEQFHLINGPPWAAVLCLTSDRQVVLVRQYRHGLGGASLELPAGVIEPSEDPIDAARRELLEESGFEAESIEPLLSTAPEPSRSSTLAHFFFAQGARAVSAPQLDHCEDLEVVLVPVSELCELIDHGHIVHAAHIAAILSAWRRGLLS